MKRLEANIRGRVQGVSFRYYTQVEASRLDLTGWVRNERDGSVSVVAEGTETDLELFLTFLKNGPRSAHVEQVSNSWSEAVMEFKDFSIRWA
jgi:acylphosphatase